MNPPLEPDCNAPKPQPWWVGLIVLILLVAFVVAIAQFCSSCSLSVDDEGKPVIGVNVQEAARAIIIYQTK